VIFAAKTDKGRRHYNEDSVLLPTGQTPLLLIAVADGMGGHAAGGRASTLAIDGLNEQMLRCAAGSISDPETLLREAIQLVNRDIYLHAQQDEGCRGMGTTLTAALLFPDQYIAVNVGDSRLYHFDGFSLTPVTRDHSLVALLVASGEITLAESHTHPRRNIITRALGASDQDRADYFHRRWNKGELVMLCSDGLHGSLSDAEMESVLRRGLPPRQLCDTLVEMALQCGAADNITVAIAKNAEEDTL
jgi:protein phosphatase